nr:hypothetical protein [Desulfobulbus oralis]
MLISSSMPADNPIQILQLSVFILPTLVQKRPINTSILPLLPQKILIAALSPGRGQAMKPKAMAHVLRHLPGFILICMFSNQFFDTVIPVHG